MRKIAPQIDLPGPILVRGGATALYQQVYEYIRSAIMTGQLKPRTRLPATRQLVAVWGVSRNVLLLAFEQLLLEGYLVAKTGAGTFVANEPLPPSFARQAPMPPSTGKSDFIPHNAFRQLAETQIRDWHTNRNDIRPFQMGVPSLRDFPFAIWSRLATQVYRGLHVQHLGYGDTAGHRPLRQAIANHVGVNRAVRCTADQVVIIQGTQQALFLLGSLLLQPGEGFWMEDPGYVIAHASLQAAGGVPCPVPVGAQGLDIQYAFTHYPTARLAFVTPSHQFPLGGTMPYPTRRSLLDWAARQESWIIEDDYDSELRFNGRSLPSLQGMDQTGRVIYMGTFSRSLFPALRLGYLILPNPEMAGLFIRAKVLLDRQGPLTEQLLLTRFIQEGHFSRHLRRMQQLYEQKQKWLLEAIQTIHPSQAILASDMGMNLVIWLPAHMDDEDVSRKLASQGIVARSLSSFTFTHPQPPALVLGYAAFSKEQMQAAADRLKDVLGQLN